MDSARVIQFPRRRADEPIYTAYEAMLEDEHVEDEWAREYERTLPRCWSCAGDATIRWPDTDKVYCANCVNTREDLRLAFAMATLQYDYTVEAFESRRRDA